MSDDYLTVRGGLVAAIVGGYAPERRLAELRAAIAAMGDVVALAERPEEAGFSLDRDTLVDVTDGDGRVVGRRRVPLIPAERRPGLLLTRLTAQLVAAEAEIGRDTLLPLDIYAESTIGQPVAWPKAYRNGRLAETDYAENAGWRAGKAPERLAAADAYRQALRDLPETHPDAATVVWPARPAGI